MTGEAARDAILREALRITGEARGRPVDTTGNGNGKHGEPVRPDAEEKE